MNCLTKFLALALVVTSIQAATIATFRTPVGSWEMEFYDEEKPVTVSNFIKYATSGRFANQFIHRWVPGFVIQGGEWRVDTSGQYQIVPVPVFGAITNEAHFGPFFSNTNGTISMARSPGIVDSATSQWFINLGDNSGPPASLDTQNGGFTVFGRVTSGMDVVNLFVPPPPTHGIFINTNVIPNRDLAVLTSSNNVTYDDLIYVQIDLRRDMDLQIAGAAGQRQVSWNSVALVTNVLEFSADPALENWQAITNLVPVRGRIEVADPSPDPFRFYRVKLFY